MKYTIKILFFVVCCFAYSNVFSQNDLLNLKVVIKNETNINSEFLEFSPSFYKDNIIFISNRKAGLKFLRKDISPEYKSASKFTTSIFESKKRDDGVQEEPNIFAEDITTSYHEGPATFTEDGKIIYFTRDSYINTVKGTAKDGKTKIKIYTADRQGNHWINVREVPGLSSDEFNTGYPTLSADGNELYFSSDRPGGQGGFDLYVSTKKGESWGTPTNLGASVNTSKTEAFPFIHKDGILFFASNGYHKDGSRSDYDVLMMEKIENSEDWTKPINFAPVNTGSDDFGLILDPQKEKGFFASNREHNNAKGEDDIYSFSVEGYLAIREEGTTTTACPVKVVVVDEGTEEVIAGAKVDYMKLDAQEVIRSLTSEGKAVTLDPIEGKDDEFNLKVVFDEENVESSETNEEGVLDDLDFCEDKVLRITKEGYKPEQIVYSPAKDGNSDEDPVIKVVMKRLVEALNIDGVVVDRITQEPIPSPLITIVNKTTGKELESFRADANGNFTFAADCGNTYAITVKASNYDPQTETLTLKKRDCWDKKKIELEFKLGTGLIGRRVPLNIYYDFNDSQIRSDAVNDLNTLASLLNTYKYLGINLASHTDTRGTDGYNKSLSERRARAAKEYLMTKGISSDRITAEGFGESRPKVDCGNNCTAVEHQVNRRTTATIRSADGLPIQYDDNPPEKIDRK